MFSALVIRDLAATIESLHQPQLASSPVIVVSGNGHLKVLGTDAWARQAGVHAGDSRKQAEFQCPDAAVVHAREEVYRRLFDAVTADLAHHIDKVEPHYHPGNALWYVQTQHQEELDVLRGRIQSHLAGAVSIGTGSGKFVARVAGISSVEHCRVAKGEEAAFLAPFPVSLLPLNVDMRRRLPMMGIRSIGDYAALSRAAVFEQWDKQGCWCYDLAIGVDSRPLQSCQPPPVIIQRLSFEDAVADKEILLSACLRLAPLLLRQLKGRAAGRLVLLLTDEHHHTHELHLRPSAPLHSPAHFQKQLPLLLEKPTYSTGILQLSLQLSELTTVQPQQLSLFEVSREQRSVIQAVNAWRQRFHETVYHLSLTDVPRHFPPALQYETEALGA